MSETKINYLELIENNKDSEAYSGENQEKERKIVLAYHFDCDPETVSEGGYDDNTFELEGEPGEYLVLTDSEATDKANEYIKESLWAFNASFIIENSNLPWEAEEMIKSFQVDKCEGANETIEAMITDLDSFCEAAISADGRGHFMNSYDGDEIEENLIGEYYIYRAN